MKGVLEILNLVVQSLPVIGKFIVQIKNKRKAKKQLQNNQNAA